MQSLRCNLRFSPACAGNINPPIIQPIKKTVQPRMCGEHAIQPLAYVFDLGSAPHVRGTWYGVVRIVSADRFSPACAGNIIRICPHPYFVAVQPRMCGEHASNTEGTQWYAGSAPHVRGTSTPQATVPRGTRFSPACAGNINNPTSLAISRAVQPRMCGEHGIVSSD